MGGEGGWDNKGEEKRGQWDILQDRRGILGEDWDKSKLKQPCCNTLTGWPISVVCGWARIKSLHGISIFNNFYSPSEWSEVYSHYWIDLVIPSGLKDLQFSYHPVKFKCGLTWSFLDKDLHFCKRFIISQLAHRILIAWHHDHKAIQLDLPLLLLNIWL